MSDASAAVVFDEFAFMAWLSEGEMEIEDMSNLVFLATPADSSMTSGDSAEGQDVDDT